MVAVSRCIVTFLILFSISTKANGNAFLRGDMPMPLRNDSQSIQAFRTEVRTAVTSALGCGKPVADSELAATRDMLVPLWRSLPKNSFGNVDRKILRYIAHRHFSRRFNIWVRGFEPTRAMNESAMDAAETLGRELPWYVEAVLKSHRGSTHGFSMEDAAYMLIMLQQIISDSETALLEHVFKEFGRTLQESLSHTEVYGVLHSYFWHWLIGDDIHTGSNLAMLHNPNHVEQAANPELLGFVDFVDGQIRTMHWLRSKVPLQNEAQSLWRNQFSFNDAHKIASAVTMSFGSYWASECRVMKEALIEMDPRGMGRVSLAKFYATSVDGKPRFAESEDYLRELGALDETSILLGTQVIIPNYLQAASNCLVSAPHYRICCSGECEHIIGEIESTLGSSAASPSSILEIVKNLIEDGDDDIDKHVSLGRTLAEQLQDIASRNSGQVKLHGRLFSQWLHYAFPRECPFPHKMGTVSHATPREYGNVSIVSFERLQRHVQDPLEMFASEALSRMDKDDLEWMAQWSSEEELLSEIGHSLHWSHSMPFHGSVILGGILVALLGGVASMASHYMTPHLRASSKHAHYV